MKYFFSPEQWCDSRGHIPPSAWRDWSDSTPDSWLLTPDSAVVLIGNSVTAPICHVPHTAPCGVLQTETVTWQPAPLFALRLTHLYTHLFIGLFE